VELDAAEPRVAVGRAEDERAGAVAEEDGERAVLVGRARALGVTRCRSRPSSASQSSHGMKPACASAPTKRIVLAAPLLMSPSMIWSPKSIARTAGGCRARDAVEPELGPQERARAREDVVRRHRREDDVVDLLGRDAGRLDGALRRLDAEVARADALGA
jgi:hypothetical protein